MSISRRLLEETTRLSQALAPLSFGPPVTHVYHPLVYAREPHSQYVTRFGATAKRVLFLGMNPGPWGMTQTGVPFGEIPAVRDWMGIEAPVDRPPHENKKRPIEGFSCKKSEVSGRRLWGLFSERYPRCEDFFAEHYVVNYCPLVWMEESGRNRTPDKLPASEMAPVNEVCDAYVMAHIELLQPECLVGVGGFAENALLRLAERCARPLQVGKILHPSPASPAANRDWAGTATRQLREMGVWQD